MNLPDGRYLSEEIAEVSPSGGLVAFLTTPHDRRGFTLEILSLPDAQPVANIPLVSDEALQAIENFQYDRQQPEQGIHPLLAILQVADVLMWSPDGAYLAFTGATQGTSSDVYFFRTQTKSITRATSGDTQAVLMGWSPASNWLIHLAAPAFSYMGPVAEGVWAASPMVPPRFLYNPEPYVINEVIIGWPSDSQFLSAGWRFEAPLDAIYSSTVSRQGRSTRADMISMGAAFDPRTGVLLLNSSGYLGFGPDLPDGLYLQPSSGTNPSMAVEGQFAFEQWQRPIQQFSALDTAHNSILLIATDGSIELELDRASAVYPSPNGQLILVEGGESSRLVTSNGDFVAEVAPFRRALWLPDSSAFFTLGCPAGIVEYAQPDWVGRATALGDNCPSALLLIP